MLDFFMGGGGSMPLLFKIPGYLGNAAVLLLSLAILATESVATGFCLGALSALNLYLVYKLDTSSNYEGQLAHELQITKMREELALARRRLSELEGRGSTAP
jgi:hypothetical protein